MPNLTDKMSPSDFLCNFDVTYALAVSEKPVIKTSDRLNCMYCKKLVDKSTLKRIPPETGKIKNVVRMGCPDCIKKIVEMRKKAKSSILLTRR